MKSLKWILLSTLVIGIVTALPAGAQEKLTTPDAIKTEIVALQLAGGDVTDAAVQKKGGIIIPDTAAAKEKPQEGKIIVVGRETSDEQPHRSLQALIALQLICRGEQGHGADRDLVTLLKALNKDIERDLKGKRTVLKKAEWLAHEALINSNHLKLVRLVEKKGRNILQNHVVAELFYRHLTDRRNLPRLDRSNKGLYRIAAIAMLQKKKELKELHRYGSVACLLVEKDVNPSFILSQKKFERTKPHINLEKLVVTGRAERGIVKVGEEVEIIGLRPTTKTVVTGVEMFRKLLDQGQAEDNVGVLLRGTKKEEVDRRRALANSQTSKVAPPAAQSRFAIREGGRTVGAGQVIIK